MKIVYMSLTGQTQKFVSKLGMDSLRITMDNSFQPINEPYIVIAPTYDIEVTEILNDFIETADNQSYLRGVCGSGNLNFSELYCFTAKDLAKAYQVPLLLNFEFQGTLNDVNIVKEKVNEIGSTESSSSR
ncbi:class Ib ribonucleoside-diphosphate reductase assembly flavoprotein NrdI [Aerococcus sp. 1KP-2016]|uniref:class Ib ribonucleoside-diphosphate reductase assembly flavoprotein NrdI n=1 Tax=Aerococcus sp. 1KP-2016 TaxID=1981982 RepID=UPI000B99425C|nr:class Ib ribonucleoside-diphosphate reductase assembly flavoprotein NrdI [Aerococcus sp. 1KP-2016]OYQ67906.1 class Ib ribonucleoside-diphosphate reductase assembly flavoprotein NrdI [Aerococcus sp. 1KP-2016]